MGVLFLAICVASALIFTANAQVIEQIDCSGRGTLVDGKCVCVNAQPSASNTVGYVGLNCEIPVTYFAKDTHTTRCERDIHSHGIRQEEGKLVSLFLLGFH